MRDSLKVEIDNGAMISEGNDWGLKVMICYPYMSISFFITKQVSEKTERIADTADIRLLRHL